MGVDIAQTCNYDIHSWCTMRIKFLRKEINHLSSNNCLMNNYVVVVVVVLGECVFGFFLPRQNTKLQWGGD